MEKEHLRAQYPFPYLTVEIEQVERFVSTSGTTGLPVMFGMTRNDFHHLLPYQMTRLLTAAGVKGLYYLDGESLLADDGEGTVDSSHPTDLGFVQHADAFEKALRPILNLKK